MELNNPNSRQLGVGRIKDTVTTGSQLMQTTVFWSFLEGKDHADNYKKHIGEFSLALTDLSRFSVGLTDFCYLSTPCQARNPHVGLVRGLQNIAPSLQKHAI